MSQLAAALKAPIPDKSPGEDGITNRMLRSGGPNFRLILYEVFQTLWEYVVQPASWERSLLQPIFKAGGKDAADPASYRGIYLISALAKLFEGIPIHRLMQYTETHNTLRENQLGTRPGRQVHDAIYILFSVIQYNLLKKGKPTYLAFLDYSTAFPSVFKVALLSLLQKFNIVGHIVRCGNTYVHDSAQWRCGYYTHRYHPHGGLGSSAGCLRVVA